MLPEAALRSIASGLADLNLDPVVHLRVVAALAPILLGELKPSGADLEPPARLARFAAKRRAKARGAKAKRAASKPNGHSRRGISISFDGQTFASRDALARHLAPRLGKNPGTVTHALRENGDDAAAVMRRYQARPPQPQPAGGLSHDARALAYLRDRLANGPVEAAEIDGMVERGKLFAASVERAKAELGVEARRINRGRGSTVHLCLPEATGA